MREPNPDAVVDPSLYGTDPEGNVIELEGPATKPG